MALCQPLALPVCMHSWETAAEVETLQPDVADRARRGKRTAEHLPRQKQLRAALSKCHSENYVKKNRHFNLLEISPLNMGVWHVWSSALYNFFFHLELSFHSYSCNYISGQICIFWRTHWSLAAIESWHVGPCSCSLGQESGKHGSFQIQSFCQLCGHEVIPSVCLAAHWEQMCGNVSK